MRGSVREKAPGVFELRVFLGRDRNGRVRQKSTTIRGTKRQAERELSRLVFEHGGQLPESETEFANRWADSTTLNEAIEAWSENGWQDLSPTTLRQYRELWERYIRNSIGTKPIADLNAYDLERYFRKLSESGTGATTLRHIRGLLHRACRLARKWSGNRLPNPVSDTELPASRGPVREPVRSPALSEVLSLLEASSNYDSRIAAFIRLIAVTGVRRGEACALRWSDIDDKACTVSIDESVIAAKGGATVKDTKTRASVRVVAIDNETLSMLRALRVEQSKVAISCGLPLPSDGFVFSAEAGGLTPPYPDAMSRAFSRVRTLAGVASDIHLHSLRHFHATVLDPVISEAQKQARLGWSTVRMARHYTDSIPEEDRRAAEHVAGLLRAKTKRESGVA